MSTILKVDDINVYYGSIHAIKGISFEVNEGEIVTLIGANGAGKSTTLNTISGLLHSKTGHIEFMGEPLNHVPSHKVVSKGLALVPEGRRIFLQMSVQENLDMGAFSRRGGNIDADMERVFEQFPRLKERRRQRRGGGPGARLRALPPPEGADAADRRYPLRRRAADAGHGPSADVQPQAADAG